MRKENVDGERFHTTATDLLVRYPQKKHVAVEAVWCVHETIPQPPTLRLKPTVKIVYVVPIDDREAGLGGRLRLVLPLHELGCGLYVMMSDEKK